MLTCRHCGWENPDEAAFCTNCGRGLARGRGGEISDRPSQRFRALGSPVVRVSDPPAAVPAAPVAPAVPRLNPPASAPSAAPTLLDFRMPEQMLAELARARDARLQGSEPPKPSSVAPAAPERLDPETIEPEAIESEPPEDAPPAAVEVALPATLQDMPTLRTSRPVELGAVARALRAEAGSPPPPRAEAPEEVVVIARSVDADELNQLLGGALDADLPPLPVLPDDPPFDEGAFDDSFPPEGGEAARGDAPAELDARPTVRLEAPADLAALLAPPSAPATEPRITQEDLPFNLPLDESADLLPDHLIEAADDSQSGLEEPDEFADLLDGPPATEGEDLVDDADDFIEEVDEGNDLLVSGELEAVNVEALARVAPPPLPAKSVRFLLRPLSENLDPHLLVPVATEPITIGRTEGELRLENDAFVSPCHARIVLEGEALFVEDLDSLNGVWIRVRGDATLVPGARFIAGQHLFRLDHVGVNGTRPRPEDGTQRLGAENRHTAFQVVVHAGDGTLTHLHRLPPEGCRVGRHVADLVFTDDSFMSGTHALLRPRDEVVLLRDLASRNGTWLRIDGRARLEAGDAVMIGRSVLRVGVPAA